MPTIDLRVNYQKARLQKSVTNPRFGDKTILVDDNWDFVELWLRRHGKEEALFFWRQARAFHEADQHLTKLSSPLTSYYSALNAAKALLVSKGVAFQTHHGLTGSSSEGKASLAKEVVILKGGGILPALCQHLGESVNGERYSLKQIFYNLAFIHRAYCVTYRGSKELFVPISDPKFVRIEGSHDCWFSAVIADKKFQHHRIVAGLAGFEKDLGCTQAYTIRRKARFEWVWGGTKQRNLESLIAEHRKIRRFTYYIHGMTRLWYIKRTNAVQDIIPRSHLTLLLMALHRISEIARYEPRLLELHFSSHHNWLLSQFLERALEQFIDECSAEITGHEFMMPGYATR